MPKYGIHHIILDDATGQLLASPSPTHKAAGEDLSLNPGMAALGAIGPDLFFWAPDYEIVARLYRLYKNIDAVVDLYNKVMEPVKKIRDAVVEPAEELVETLAPATVALIRSLIEEMQESTKLLKATISTGLFSGVISGFDLLTDLASLPSVSGQLFRLLTPPLQGNEPEKRWYWYDMTHYRNTGDFARQLVALAVDPSSRAYAYGYLSHIAADTLGHGFVNQIVGGPWRHQIQRHITVESFMDCWEFKWRYNASVNRTLVDKLALPPTLPTGVGDLIWNAFEGAYGALPEDRRPQRLPAPGFLSRHQIDQTYEILYEVLQIMKKMVVGRPEEPFSGVADVMADALGDFLQSPPSPPSSLSSGCSLNDTLAFGTTESSRACYDEFFDNLSDWMDYCGELIEWALETLFDLFDLLLAKLLLLPIVVLLAILYALQLFIYAMYRSVQSILALYGFVYPEPEDLATSHGRNLTTTFLGCSPPFKYPKRTDLAVSHLVCPLSTLEFPTTVADFYGAAATTTPDHFIRGSWVPFDFASLEMYAKSKSPEQTRGLERKGYRIGNATDLTAWMIGVASDPGAGEDLKRIAFTNWNLDADRGYGYKAWEGEIPGPGEEAVAGEAFVEI